MSNIREQLLAKTAGIKATDARKPDATRKATRTQTAPGMAGALAAAQLRVQELESNGASSELPVGEIMPNPWQPRRVFNEAKLTELAESIREVGLMQPVVVRRAESGYQIIAGERRWRAHKMLGQENIRAVVIDCTDQDMAVLALVENVSRDDLTDYEISVSIRRSEQEFPDRKRMADALGMSRARLYRYFAFESLPDFVRKSLDLKPTLLGGHAAQDVVATLKKHGDDGVRTASELWPDVVSGDLAQGKYAAAIAALASKRGTSGDVGGGRSIEKFFSAREQAGNITKDLGHFTVKIKTTMLTEDQEREIRDVIGRLFSTQPKSQ